MVAGDEGVVIRGGAVEQVARVLREKGVGSLNTLDLFDTRFYPPRSAGREDVLRYFLVMVALDHRLSRPGRRYEACLPDGCYHGADLLYRLGAKTFLEDPGFYSPARLASLTIDGFRSRFEIDGASIPDPEIRVMLLRDIGFKLEKLYDGRVGVVLERSGGWIRRWPGPGLLDLLRVFRAYEDPVEKKSFLFIKFIVGRGLYQPRDPENIDVPVDNHLVRIALRLGIIEPVGETRRLIEEWVEVDRETDTAIRLAARRAYRLLARESGVPPTLLDDHLWIHGRTICIRDGEPRCGDCMFRMVCRANAAKQYIREHRHYNTWYY